MKKVSIFMCSAFIALLFSSCMSLSLTPYHNEPYVTNACDLSREDVRFIKKVKSETYYTYVLWFGGFKNRRTNLIQELYKNVDIEHHRYVVNITTTEYMTIIGPVSVRRIFAEGDLVEIKPHEKKEEGTNASIAIGNGADNQPIVEAKEKEVDQSEILAANRYYLAWLIKTGKLERKEIKNDYYNELVFIARAHTTAELEELSEKHSEEVEKYRKK